MTQNYDVLNADGTPIKAWVRGVALDEGAVLQLTHIANLPFIYKWVAAMPDVHVGKGATIGSVIATRNAIIPAAVGVDIGCGMMAVRTSLCSRDLPDHLERIRAAIERAVPHGRTGGRHRDAGAWDEIPSAIGSRWAELEPRFAELCARYPQLKNANTVSHLGTLGTGNHFIELCLDEADRLWVMLHSGSRGVGNRIGSHFIALAKKEMERWFIHLPDRDLAYLSEGSNHFNDYCSAVEWAQDYARLNREEMMASVLRALRDSRNLPPFTVQESAVNCHHNYISRESHFGENVWITRKGAVRARRGELGIIPGSMGAHSFIVRGKGHPESFCSCSHGAGRAMTRTEARKRFTVEDHMAATAGIECRKDEAVIDETPMAYKPIDAVMAAQRDLVDVVHTLNQVVCVKG